MSVGHVLMSIYAAVLHHWTDVDGTESVLVGSMDAMADGQAVPSPGKP